MPAHGTNVIHIPDRSVGQAETLLLRESPAEDSHLKLEEVEARHIRHVMELTRGRIEGKNGAAMLLGMNPATLRYRMQKLHIPFGRKKAEWSKEGVK
jgi:transcriptional regulator with GAF, ATPase, and Fis domain